MAWVILGGQTLVIAACLWAVRSFGRFTKQVLHTRRSNELMLRELKLLDRRVFEDASSHVATFVQIDPDEQESA